MKINFWMFIILPSVHFICSSLKESCIPGNFIFFLMDFLMDASTSIRKCEESVMFQLPLQVQYSHCIFLVPCLHAIGGMSSGCPCLHVNALCLALTDPLSVCNHQPHCRMWKEPRTLAPSGIACTRLTLLFLDISVVLRQVHFSGFPHCRVLFRQ